MVNIMLKFIDQLLWDVIVKTLLALAQSDSSITCYHGEAA